MKKRIWLLVTLGVMIVPSMAAWADEAFPDRRVDKFQSGETNTLKLIPAQALQCSRMSKANGFEASRSGPSRAQSGVTVGSAE